MKGLGDDAAADDGDDAAADDGDDAAQWVGNRV